VKSGRAAIAAVCGGLLIVAGLLWWQSPTNGSEPTATGTADRTKVGKTLRGEGKAQPSAPDPQREQVASRPLDKPPDKTTNGSLLLHVVYGDDKAPALSTCGTLSSWRKTISGST
jgi:hypothetical protein